MPIDVCIMPESFDPWSELARVTEVLAKGQYGACVSFVGTMRDFNDDAHVNSMELEYYPGMTERQLQHLGSVAAARWNVSHIIVQHRVGKIAPGEAIVLVAVWSAHRAEAFAACRFLIDELKTNAPFWKKEFRDSGVHWVSTNS